MAVNSRWIKAYTERAAANPWLQDWDCYGIFFFLIGEAKWTRRSQWIPEINQVVELERGQVWVSRASLAKGKTTERRVRTILKRLKNGQLIDLQTDQRGTIVTICNYNKYQSDDKKVTKQTADQMAMVWPRSGQPIEKEGVETLESIERVTADVARPVDNSASSSNPTGSKKFKMTLDWKMSRALNEELEGLFLGELGVDGFWRQVERFIRHHAEAGTLATPATFRKLLLGWMTKAEDNRP